jgi:hypothetical protein
LLPLVRDHGILELQNGSVRLVSLIVGPWTFNHWTPFNEVGAEEAASPGYRLALKRQHPDEDLPYGFEVWRGVKVLSLLWSDAGDLKVVCFEPGPWQDEALALSLPDHTPK